MSTYSELLGILPTDLGTPSEPTAKAVLSVIQGYGSDGVLASVLRNRFQRASKDHVMGIVASLHNRGAVDADATGRFHKGHPVVRISIAKGAVDVLEPMSGLRGRIVKAISADGPLSLKALTHRFRPVAQDAILDELRAMHSELMIDFYAKGKYVYRASKGKRKRTR